MTFRTPCARCRAIREGVVFHLTPLMEGVERDDAIGAAAQPFPSRVAGGAVDFEGV